MRLGIDLDGVVANFTLGWMTRYNAETGASLRPEEVSTWGAMIPLTRFQTMGEFWRWAHNGPGPSIFRNLPTYPGAVEALQRLSAKNDIVIITTKPPWAVPDTEAWIIDVGIPTDEVHYTSEKWRVDCEVYLDDAPHQLEELTLHRPDREVCRYVRPWNAPVRGARDIRDWDEFSALVDQVWC